MEVTFDDGVTVSTQEEYNALIASCADCAASNRGVCDTHTLPEYNDMACDCESCRKAGE